MVNLSGSVGGKYGAKTHFSTHLLLSILHAAHGLNITAVGDEGPLVGDVPGDETVDDDGDRVGEPAATAIVAVPPVVVVDLSLHSSIDGGRVNRWKGRVGSV